LPPPYRGDDDAMVKSGFPALDEIVPGFYPGELILLGGRPSMGKTAVALGIALNAARKGHGVCIASLEMNPEAMAMRAISEATAHAGRSVHYSTMRRGDIMDGDIDVIHRVSADVGKLPITFLSREYSDLGALFAGVKQAERTGTCACWWWIMRSF
jgi:replicative DNA helicase